MYSEREAGNDHKAEAAAFTGRSEGMLKGRRRRESAHKHAEEDL